MLPQAEQPSFPQSQSTIPTEQLYAVFFFSRLLNSMARPYPDSGGPSCLPHAFESERSRVEIAFYAVFLVVYTILLCVGCIRIPKPLQNKSCLLALLSIICAIVYGPQEQKRLRK